MRVTYDSKADALAIIFADTEVITVEREDGIVLELDAQGNIAGIEILDAKKRLSGKHNFDESKELVVSGA